MDIWKEIKSRKNRTLKIHCQKRERRHVCRNYKSCQKHVNNFVYAKKNADYAMLLPVMDVIIPSLTEQNVLVLPASINKKKSREFCPGLFIYKFFSLFFYIRIFFQPDYPFILLKPSQLALGIVFAFPEKFFLHFRFRNFFLQI